MTIQISMSSASKDFKCDLHSLKKWIDIITTNTPQRDRCINEEIVYSRICEHLQPIIGETDDRVVFIQTDTIGKWLLPLGISVEDIRRMASSKFLTEIRRFPTSSQSKYRSSGIMLRGKNVTAEAVKSVIIVGGVPVRKICEESSTPAVNTVVEAILDRENNH